MAHSNRYSSGRYSRPNAPLPSSLYSVPDTSGRMPDEAYPWLGKVLREGFTAGGAETEKRTGRGHARESAGRPLPSGTISEQLEDFTSKPNYPRVQMDQYKAPNLSGGVRDPSRRPPGKGIGLSRLDAVKDSKEGPGFLKRNKDILLDLGLGMMSGRPGANFLETVGTAGMQAVNRKEGRESRDLQRARDLKEDLRRDEYTKAQIKQISIQAKKFERENNDIVQWSTDDEGYLIGLPRDTKGKVFEPKDSKGNRIKPAKTAKNPIAAAAVKIFSEGAGEYTMEEATEAARKAYSLSGNLSYNPTTGRVE